MYITIFVCIAILIVSFAVIALFLRRTKKPAFIFFICLFTLAFEMFLYILLPACDVCYDTVRITALGQKNENARSTEVFISGLTIQRAARPFPEITSGKWCWFQGTYCWFPDPTEHIPEDLTQSVELKIPAGIGREIIFVAHSWRGLAEVEIGGHSEVVDLYAQKTTNISVPLPDSEDSLVIKNELFRVCVFVILHILVFTFVYSIALRRGEYAATLTRWKYEITFFTLSLFMIIKYGQYPAQHAYSSTQYLIGYEFGFAKRGLIGEIVLNLTTYLREEKFVNFKLCAILLTHLAVAVLLGRIIHRQRDEKIRWFFLLFVFSLPCTFLYTAWLDFRTDIYLVILFVAATVFIGKGTALWIVPIVITNMLLINETSIMCLFPIILAMLLYKFAKYRELAYLSTALGSFLCGFSLWLIFLFGGTPYSHYTGDQIYQHMQKHTDFALAQSAFNAEALALGGHLDNMAVQVAVFYRTALAFFLSFLPAVVLLVLLWMTIYKKMKGTSVLQRGSMIVLALSPTCAFAAMILATDYGRYTGFLLIGSVAGILFVLCEEKMELSYCELRFGDAAEHTLNIMPVAICVFYLVFGVFRTHIGSMPDLSKLVNFITTLFHG